MPFRVIREDITRVHADAIVNTANPKPIYSDGTDYAIYQAAGAEQLLAERRKIGNMKPGQAVVTPAFELPAKILIHTVGPVWKGGRFKEKEHLTACYRNSLQLAWEEGCESIAFPMISTGSYGFPKELALQIALSCVSEFLSEHEMQVYLVVFGADSLDTTRKIFSDIEEYIDSHYVEEKLREEYTCGFPDMSVEMESFTCPHNENWDRDYSIGFPDMAVDRENSVGLPHANADRESAVSFPGRREREDFAYDRIDGRRRSASASLDSAPAEYLREDAMMYAPFEAPKASPDSSKVSRPGKGTSIFSVKKKASSGRSLEDIMDEIGDTFQERLFRLIHVKGKSNVEIYQAALINKKLFSKIKSNKEYQPKKNTAIALALALELNLDEARDLLGRAGYAFSPSSKVDLVVQYFIEHEVYDLGVIDLALVEHDLPMIGTYE